MKIKIIKPTFHRGKLCKVGDTIDAEDQDLANLIAAGKAVKAEAKTKTAK